MFSEDIFNSNIELLEQKSPYDAFVLRHYKKPDHDIFLYSNIEWEENNVDVVYVYGISCKKTYRQWLEDHYIVFLEDSLDVFYQFLGTAFATYCLEHPRIWVYYVGKKNRYDQLVDQLTWFFVSLRPHIVSTDYYRKIKLRESEEVLSHIMKLSIYKNYISKGDLQYSYSFFKNFYNNLATLKLSYQGSQLSGEYNNIPAIICGAGPSLKKNLNTLKDIHDRALIFAGGSTLNLLYQNAIRPHFSFGIDPTLEEVRRFSCNHCYEVPFFYRMRLCHQALEVVHASLLYISGPGWYPLEKWVENEIGIYQGLVDEGFSVTCFAAEIAKIMGCNPIIFIGMDLAYTDMKEYASDVNASYTLSASDIKKTEKYWFGSVQTKNIYGENVYSKWHWIIESYYLSKCVIDLGHRFVNATEGGIGIEGVENVSFKKAMDKYLKKKYDLRNIVHANIQMLDKIQASGKKVQGILKKYLISLKRCRSIYKKMLEEVLLAESFIRNKKELRNIKNILLQNDLEKEFAYGQFLKSLDIVWEKSMQRKRFYILLECKPHFLKQMLLLKMEAEKILVMKHEIDRHIVLLNSCLFN